MASSFSSDPFVQYHAASGPPPPPGAALPLYQASTTGEAASSAYPFTAVLPFSTGSVSADAVALPTPPLTTAAAAPPAPPPGYHHKHTHVDPHIHTQHAEHHAYAQDSANPLLHQRIAAAQAIARPPSATSLHGLAQPQSVLANPYFAHPHHDAHQYSAILAAGDAATAATSNAATATPAAITPAAVAAVAVGPGSRAPTPPIVAPLSASTAGLLPGAATVQGTALGATGVHLDGTVAPVDVTVDAGIAVGLNVDMDVDMNVEAPQQAGHPLQSGSASTYPVGMAAGVPISEVAVGDPWVRARAVSAGPACLDPATATHSSLSLNNAMAGFAIDHPDLAASSSAAVVDLTAPGSAHQVLPHAQAYCGQQATAAILAAHRPVHVATTGSDSLASFPGAVGVTPAVPGVSGQSGAPDSLGSRATARQVSGREYLDDSTVTTGNTRHARRTPLPPSPTRQARIAPRLDQAEVAPKKARKIFATPIAARPASPAAAAAAASKGTENLSDKVKNTEKTVQKGRAGDAGENDGRSHDGRRSQSRAETRAKTRTAVSADSVAPSASEDDDENRGSGHAVANGEASPILRASLRSPSSPVSAQKGGNSDKGGNDSCSEGGSELGASGGGAGCGVGSDIGADTGVDGDCEDGGDCDDCEGGDRRSNATDGAIARDQRAAAKNVDDMDREDQDRVAAFCVLRRAIDKDNSSGSGLGGGRGRRRGGGARSSEGDSVYKREQRALKNREAADRSRKKKRENAIRLEGENSRLLKETYEKDLEISALRSEQLRMCDRVRQLMAYNLAATNALANNNIVLNTDHLSRFMPRDM